MKKAAQSKFLLKKAVLGGTVLEEYWANREVVENKSIVRIRLQRVRV